MSDDSTRKRLEWEEAMSPDGSMGIDAFVERWCPEAVREARR
jgi:hypothetical protein